VDDDIFGLACCGSAAAVSVFRDGDTDDLVGAAVVVVTAEVLCTPCTFTEELPAESAEDLRSKKPGLDRSGSDDTNRP
jgi:hypothetical protein